MKKTNKGSYVTVTEDFFVMRDGVRLYTRCTHLNNLDKCPIIFMRTPYDKSGEEIVPDNYANDDFVKNGYAVIRQHCRGTGNSEGDCIPYIERNDGLDTLDIIRKLPFYNGEIYLVGGSYLATVHYSYLSAKPKDVKGAVFSIQTDRMYFRNYKNGCCWDFCNINWWLKMLKRQYPEYTTENIIKRPYKDIIKRAVGEDVAEFTSCLMNNEYNDFWKEDCKTDIVDYIDFPVLFCDGWYDYYIDGTFSMWERLNDKIKKKCAYVIGPWEHATKTDRFENGNIPENFNYLWIDAIRNNKELEFAQCGKINYYSIGAKRWDSTTLPLGTNNLRLYLTEDKKLSASKSTGNFSYTYNPHIRPEIMDKTVIDENEFCDNIISFFSDTFDSEASFFGRINLNIAVSSDCEDTVFYARLFLVENGTARYLTETISTLSNSNGNYAPGTRLDLNINCSPIGFTVNKGAKIRLDISSVSPKYVPHANVKGHWATVTETKIAHNCIYCDGSYIDLPEGK